MKKSLSLFMPALFTIVLFVLLLCINGATPRIPAASLTSDIIYSNGPVILEGDELLRTEEGFYEYHLQFHWDGAGYLYLYHSNPITINGISPQSDFSYRQSIYTLPYSENGNYDVCLIFSTPLVTAFEKTIYFGTFAQINESVISSIECVYYIRGLGFAVALFSFFLFFWKRNERYLIWLALLAFTVSYYQRAEEILRLFSWIPQLSFLTDTYFYRIFNDVLVAILQCKALQKLLPSQVDLRLALPLVIVSSIPAFSSYTQPLYFILFDSIFYGILYCYYLYCFSHIPKTMHMEQRIFMTAWLSTTTSRFFEHLCEVGILANGMINLTLRFRGIISIIYIIAFFLVACKRFAQKFQEADDLNVHLEEEILKKSRQQTTFIRSMLHNLKTPLFSLSGYSDMALKTIDTQLRQPDSISSEPMKKPSTPDT